MLVDGRHHAGTVPHRGRHPCRASPPHVADGEDPGYRGLESATPLGSGDEVARLVARDVVEQVGPDGPR